MTDQPPPPPGGYPGGQPPYYYRPAPPFNTYAILALVLAIFVLPPLGIYFGKKAQQQIATTGERGIELANAAVVVGWVLSILMALFLIVWCGFFFVFASGFAGFTSSF